MSIEFLTEQTKTEEKSIIEEYVIKAERNKDGLYVFKDLKHNNSGNNVFSYNTCDNINLFEGLSKLRNAMIAACCEIFNEEKIHIDEKFSGIWLSIKDRSKTFIPFNRYSFNEKENKLIYKIKE